MNRIIKKYSSIWFVLALILILQQMPVSANQGDIPVEVPNFPVHLNGFAVPDNTQYPLLVYKGITYVPLTQELANLLNLTVVWNPHVSSLYVIADPTPKSNLSGLSEGTVNNKTKRFYAKDADYPVYVNEQPIDRTYPALNCQDITYFPLTWAIAVEQLGWSYSFDSVTGLTINSQNYSPD
ncbi:hypothetical protein EII17_11935 [Clostridiales bacterium COT073_COT-073]|nr:hypothetical protein EII17_11935 [Clostridiales bacterium COT073_COT-073]